MDLEAEAAAGIPSDTAIMTICSHGNTMVEKKNDKYFLKEIDFVELLPEDKKGLDCELFYMGVVPQGVAATHTSHTLKLFREVANKYIIPIILSSRDKATKIAEIQQILPEFLIGYTKLIIPHIKILLQNANDKLSHTGFTELLVDTNEKVNSRKPKEDRLKASEVPTIMNDITKISEEVQDLVNLLCAIFFHPELVVWCAFIDQDNPLFYKKLFSTELDLLEENKKEYSWDIICELLGQEFGLFGNPEIREQIFPKMNMQNNLTTTNENLIRSVFEIERITKGVIIDGSCSIVLDSKTNSHVTDERYIHGIQQETDELLRTNKIIMTPEQAERVSQIVKELFMRDHELLNLLNDSFIEHGNLTFIGADILKSKHNMPKSFKSFIINTNIALMTANKNGLLYSSELNAFLRSAFDSQKMKRHSSVTVSSKRQPTSEIEEQSILGKRGSSVGGPIRALKVIDDLSLNAARQKLKKISGPNAGGSRHKRSRRRNGSKKKIKRARPKKTKKRRRTKKRIRK